MKKFLVICFLVLGLFSKGYCAWDKTLPANTTKLSDTPTILQANWQALETGTDSALLVTNAKISASAAIADTKLATITIAGKVNGTAFTGLAYTPSGAGILPIANTPYGTSAYQLIRLDASAKIPAVDGSQLTGITASALSITSQTQGDLLYYSGSAWVRLGAGTSGYILKTGGAGANPSWLSTLPTANGGTGSTANANAASGVVVLDASSKLPAVDGSQLTTLNTTKVYTADGTWKAPTGITTAYITVVGGGGGGAGGEATTGGGGGGGGQTKIDYPTTVTPGSTYTITIGDAGQGGAYGVAGTAGGTTSFGSVSASGGGLGGLTNGGTGGGTDHDGGIPTAGGGFFHGGNGGGGGSSPGGGGGGTPFGTGGTGGSGADDSGNVGSGYGSGGGGAGEKNSINTVGADGRAGLCIVKW